MTGCLCCSFLADSFSCQGNAVCRLRVRRHLRIPPSSLEHWKSLNRLQGLITLLEAVLFLVAPCQAAHCRAVLFQVALFLEARFRAAHCLGEPSQAARYPEEHYQEGRYPEAHWKADHFNDAPLASIRSRR